MPSLVDVALIVKNEAENLPTCLESLQVLAPVLGTINVYDTGSTDGTQDIARSHGATVQQGYWDEDFSRARNEAIAMCGSKWVLILDADERIEGDPALLKKRLLTARPDTDALTVQQRDHGVGGHTAWSCRILHRQRMHYIGTIHETPVRRAGGAVTTVETPPTALSFTHVGYLAAAMPEKLSRNLELADREVQRARAAAQEPELFRALVDRARTLRSLGRVEEALRDFEEVQSFPFHGAYHTWALEKYGDLLIDLERCDDAEAVVARLAEHGSDPGRLAFMQARIAVLREDFPTALNLIRTVDTVSDAVRVSHATTAVIRLRMFAALKTEQYDESLACALQLMVSHREAEGLGELVVTLWGDRPLAALAGILSEAPADFHPELATELATAGPRGQAVADSLRTPAPA